MKINEAFSNQKVEFAGIESSYFLVGLLTAFDNRFQAAADKAIGEISWKQFFAIICINLCKEEPTIKELAEIIGSSHQNVKQILLKLEKKGFVSFYKDQNDNRKQRIHLTDYCYDFCEKNNELSNQFMKKLFSEVSQSQLKITIRTMLQIEENLKKF